MKPFNVVNYHLTESCNYSCRYCFAKFEKGALLDLGEKRKIIENVCRYFRESNLLGRINFAGGEPLLDRDLDELIDCAYQNGAKASIVTNGSLLTEERIRAWQGKVTCIGVSVDSANKEVNKQIGRECRGESLSIERLLVLTNCMRDNEIKLKINTVVSKYNLNEDLTWVYKLLHPDRLKFLQMQIVKAANEKAQNAQITDSEFEEFCRRHQSCKPVIERKGSMENSYLMIDPKGYFIINNNGEYKKFGSCLQTPFGELLCRSPINEEKFAARYKNQ